MTLSFMLKLLSQPGVNEVDTTCCFSSQYTWKDKYQLLGWIRRQTSRVEFIVVLRRSIINKESNVGVGL